MKLLQIAEDTNVDMDKIEAIKRNSDNTTLVYTANNVFISKFPYETFLALFKKEVESESKKRIPVDTGEHFGG